MACSLHTTFWLAVSAVFAAARLQNRRKLLSPSESWSVPPLSARPCTQLAKKTRVRIPSHLLVGDAGGTDMYSGYINVTEMDHLFYWFAEAQATAPKDAPLIIWSNGGPGCSAMEGMTTEHGPFVLYGVKEDPKQFSGRMSKNPYSWNTEAHVLYVDQPRYVGYSCGTGPAITSSVDAGKDMVNFIRGWLLVYPEHAHRPIILAAESYGGHYIPAWSAAIMDYNKDASSPLPLAGLAIGNGDIDDAIQSHSFPEFAVKQGLLDNANGVSDWGARELVKRNLGYQPNYYDYRLIEQECCGCSSYNYQSWSNWLLRPDVAEFLHVDREVGMKAFANCAAGCINLPDFDKNDTFDYLGALGRALQSGIKVTLYYGMQDTACDYVGGYKVASTIRWQGVAEFAQAPLEDLVINGMSTGKFKTAAGLSWVQVDGAGHMVPVNNPAAALHAIRQLTRSVSVSKSSDANKDGNVLVLQRKYKQDDHTAVPRLTKHDLLGLVQSLGSRTAILALALAVLVALMSVATWRTRAAAFKRLRQVEPVNSFLMPQGEQLERVRSVQCSAEMEHTRVVCMN